MGKRSVGFIGAVVVMVSVGLVSTALPASAFTATPERIIPTPFVSGHAGLYAWGAATMPDGSVLFGDYQNDRIQHYSSNGALLAKNMIVTPEIPYGLAVDPRNGDIYEATGPRKIVRKYSATGQALLTIGPGRGDGGTYSYPARVAVASDGTVFIVDMWNNNIVATRPDGTFLFKWGTRGSGSGQFKQPHAIGVDASDRLYVVDHGNYRVEVFNKSGQFLYSFGSNAPGTCQITGDPRGLAVDKVHGWVYVVDKAGNDVDKFDLAGHCLASFGSYGSGQGQFVDGGREATIDGDGDLWVGDMPNFRAQEFSSSGQFLQAVPDPPEPPPVGGFNGPHGVAVDAAGNIFVTDTFNHRVEKFDASGKFLIAWGHRGRGNYVFNYPRMIAVDPRPASQGGQTVVIADTDSNVIKKYTNDGVFVWSVKGFSYPRGVDVGSDGKIYVANPNADRIDVLNQNGGKLLSFGSSSLFGYVQGVAVDSDGTIWTADSGKNVVKHFSATGDLLTTIPTTVGTCALNGPFDLETDANYVYVADTNLHRINVYTKNGGCVTWFGTKGSALGQLKRPQGLDLTPSGHLYVAEEFNDRIQDWLIS